MSSRVVRRDVAYLVRELSQRAAEEVGCLPPGRAAIEYWMGLLARLMFRDFNAELQRIQVKAMDDEIEAEQCELCCDAEADRTCTNCGMLICVDCVGNQSTDWCECARCDPDTPAREAWEDLDLRAYMGK